MSNSTFIAINYQLIGSVADNQAKSNSSLNSINHQLIGSIADNQAAVSISVLKRVIG